MRARVLPCGRRNSPRSRFAGHSCRRVCDHRGRVFLEVRTQSSSHPTTIGLGCCGDTLVDRGLRRFPTKHTPPQLLLATRPVSRCRVADPERVLIGPNALLPARSPQIIHPSHSRSLLGPTAHSCTSSTHGRLSPLPAAPLALITAT